MFENVGAKMKTVAKVFFWIGFVSWLILGLIYFVFVVDSFRTIHLSDLLLTVLVTILVTAAGCFASWFSAMFYTVSDS